MDNLTNLATSYGKDKKLERKISKLEKKIKA